MKIEVGEYVRTKDGKIGIFDRYSSRPDNSIYKCPANCFIKLKGRKTPLQCWRDYIVKHSKEKIDLVELYDYVNGFLVFDIIQTEDGHKLIKFTNGRLLENKDIETIATKESFKSIEYEV